MRQDVVGINEQAINKLIMDIYDCADRINIILNSIDDIVAGTSSYFVNESANNFRRKFEQLKLNFPTVNYNIKSYAEDLTKLKNSYSNIIDDAKHIVKKNIDLIPFDDIEIL